MNSIGIATKSGKKVNLEFAQGDDLDKALELVARVYYRAELLKNSEVLDLWLTDYKLPDTKTIVAKTDEGRMVGTISIFYDNPHEPIKPSSYPRAAEYRKQGKRFADVGRFAVDNELLTEEDISLNFVAPPLIARVMRYGLEHEELDLYCLEVSKRHSPLYLAIGCKRDGEPQTRDFEGQGAHRFLYPFVLDLREARKYAREWAERNFTWKLALQEDL